MGPEDFVKKSFKSLSKREDKDSILKEFNIKQIREYFPEYETEIKRQYKNDVLYHSLTEKEPLII
jgi:hypothetical protein